MAGYKAPIYSHAREVLSLGSQARLGNADSYVHAGSVRRNRVSLAIWWCSPNIQVEGYEVLRMAAVSLLSSLCLPVVTTRRGEPGR